ncbi:MAG: hypothetical protein R3A44_24920 [Caldilineaceae bacterium]
MKRLICGMIWGFGLCLALLWLVETNGDALIQTALAQSTVPDPTIYDKPIPDTVQSNTVSRDVLEYGRLIFVSSRRIAGEALAEVAPKLLAARESDTQWVFTSNEILAALFQTAEKELATIEPPVSTLEAHQILLGALNNCSHSVQSAGQGMETIQPAYIQQALEQMNRCAHQVADATDIMLALGKEITGATALPAPTVAPTLALTPTATATVAPTATAIVSATEMPTTTASVQLTATPLPTIAPLATLTDTQGSQTDMPIYVFDPRLIMNTPATCDCSAKRYWCANFISRADAQLCYDRCQEQAGFDIHELDPDADGMACEER